LKDATKVLKDQIPRRTFHWKDHLSKFRREVYLDSLSGHYQLKGIGKGGKKFDKLLHPSLYERILAFRERRHVSTVDTGPLFPTKNGDYYQYKNLSNYIVRIIERTELPFVKEWTDRITPHYFRHFYTIYSRQQGGRYFLNSKSSCL